MIERSYKITKDRRVSIQAHWFRINGGEWQRGRCAIKVKKGDIVDCRYPHETAAA